MTHTKGPWFAFKNIVTDKKSFEILENGERVGDTPNWIIVAQHEQDANLIAAAPELLEALKIANKELKRLQSFINSGNEWALPYSNSAINAAIAKAEGRP